MVEMLIKFAILIVVLVVVWFVVTWALAMVGIVIPDFIAAGIIAILVLLALLYAWRNRGSLGL